MREPPSGLRAHFNIAICRKTQFRRDNSDKSKKIEAITKESEGSLNEQKNK